MGPMRAPVWNYGEVQQLTEPFGIGTVTGIAAIPRSFRAHKLDTTHGSFVLSAFPPEVTRDHLAAMQEVRLALVASGLPAVAALVGRDGHIAETADGRLVQVQPWVPHDTYADSWPRLVAAAGVLGRMHDVMAACEAVPDQRGAPWSWPATQVARLASEAQDLLDSAIRAGHDITAEVAVAQRILHTLAMQSCLAPERPVQLTHGDFHVRNILVHNGIVNAVVDFECLDFRPRLFDLAWPLVFWCFYGSGHGQWRDGDWSAAAACCRAYADATDRAPTDDEWRQLPLLMAAIPAYGIAHAPDESDPVAEVRAFARVLPFAESLVDNPDDAIARLVP